MPEVSVAERILARLTSREHAATTVGDLMEEVPGCGGWPLLLAVVRIILHKYWRVVAAVPITLLFRYGRFSPEHFVMKFHGAQSLPHSFWTIPLYWALDFSWFLFPYFVVRYGWRDSTTQAGGVVFVLFHVVWLSGANASSSALGLVGFLALIGGAALSSRHRDAAFVLVTVVLVYALNLGLVISVGQGLVEFAMQHHAPLVFWPATAAIYVGCVNLLLTVTFVHRWLRERRSRLQIVVP